VVFLQGIFNVLWCPNVVFWMVKRGGGVVFCVAGSARKSRRKNAPAFLTFSKKFRIAGEEKPASQAKSFRFVQEDSGKELEVSHLVF
jgi:hypothetical protein